MFCKHCGKEIADDAVVCPECGRSVDSSVAASTIDFFEEEPATPVIDNATNNTTNNTTNNATKNATDSGTYSILSIIGFAFSFVATIAGLILSILGYQEAKRLGDIKSEGMARAGIIISSILLGLKAIVIIVSVFMQGLAVLTEMLYY